MPRRTKKKIDTPRRMPVRNGDIVEVITGRDGPHGGEAGMQGRVLRTYPRTGRIVVEGVSLLKRHTKPNAQQGIKGGVVEKEGPIHVSNVRVVRREQSKG